MRYIQFEIMLLCAKRALVISSHVVVPSHQQIISYIISSILKKFHSRNCICLVIWIYCFLYNYIKLTYENLISKGGYHSVLLYCWKPMIRIHNLRNITVSNSSFIQIFAIKSVIFLHNCSTSMLKISQNVMLYKADVLLTK